MSVAASGVAGDFWKAVLDRIVETPGQKKFRYAKGTVRVADIERELNEDILIFKAFINERFKRLNLNASRSIDLAGVYGQVVVTSYHPEKKVIERLFADDYGLRDLFIKIRNFAYLVEGVREIIAFEAAYAQNPRKAIAQYQFQLSELNMDRFYMKLRTVNGSWIAEVQPNEDFKARFNSRSSEEIVLNPPA
ncbi:MAG: hypothetical protein ACM3PE_05540 [Deltaproteobacteria bacterium]